MNQISAQELNSLLESGREVQIIDVREYHEVDSGNMGGSHIPMAEVMDRRHELSQTCPVVVHCRTGKRGAAVAYMLREEYGMENVVNLEGGLVAWAESFDPELVVY